MRPKLPPDRKSERTSPHTLTSGPSASWASSVPSDLEPIGVLLVVRAFRWALGPPQIPRLRSELYFPTTLDRYSELALRLSQGRPFGPPTGLSTARDDPQFSDGWRGRQYSFESFLRAPRGFFPPYAQSSAGRLGRLHRVLRSRGIKLVKLARGTTPRKFPRRTNGRTGEPCPHPPVGKNLPSAVRESFARVRLD